MDIRMIKAPSQPCPVLDPDNEQRGHPLADTIEARIAHFPDD
ncbi:hypothetical protein [Burkholderia sp. S171]|nr:hypothetical protein [Burkholderia sp. S171]